MKKKIIFLQITGGPLVKEGKICFLEGGLVHAVSAGANLLDLVIQKDEYLVTVLCLNQQGLNGMKEIDFRGVKIISLGGSRWLGWAQFGNLNFFREAYQYIKKENPDILIGNNVLAALFIKFLPQKCKKIGIIHHLYLSLEPINKFQPLVYLISIFEKLAIPFLKKLDALGAVNPLTRDLLIKKGVSPNKILVVGNGIDLEDFPFLDRKDKNSLIYIGRLAELKGVEALLDVVFEIKKEIPKVILHLGGEGPKFSAIKEKTKKLGLENNVIIHGYLDYQKKIEVLKSSALYLSLSEFEGFGIPLIEAMATGCVPVVSDIYAHRFIFQERKVGFLVKSKKEMVQKIVGLLKDEDARLSLAKEGQRLVQERWSWQEVGRRYKELISIANTH